VTGTSPGQNEAESASGAGELDIDTIRILELRHRIKNLLAIVQAVANQTLRSGRSIEEARKALDGRLTAMGKAVDMLLHTGWTEADLKVLIGRALVHVGRPVGFDGPPVTVGADAAMALTLVFHELESNSIKYGALASDEGVVAIEWSLVPGAGGDWLKLEWSERDGPPCVMPTHQGFGSRMISKLLGGRFGATAETEYRPDGLDWKLSAPLARLAH
jgi:two-component sensor histidine kinase